ncbi:trypsin-like serine protease [Enterovibrio norvegicus]|uniref:trypsin-like serine protease n=1 Tax=Enterovibrio norvegicus TaxID=188144 RepID=UPI000C84D99F|nr:trypsin-like serine protease [Enterovibrio norvegicus]PMH64538.1 hypothetical protein BCU62_15905 [Enterovibrio norvegicus]
MKNLVSVAVIAALTTFNAHAVRLGSDVAESDYSDYVVRFEVKDTTGQTATCGGLLVAGEYIVTAGHCVGAYNHNGANTEYLWWSDNGASNSISVFQGVEYFADKKTETTYRVVDILSSFTDVHAAANVEVDAVKANYPTSNWAQHDFVFTDSYLTGAFHHDIALVKLNTKISQTTHAAMTPMYDSVNNAFNVAGDDSFTFRGWGVNEFLERPSTMQSTELVLKSDDPTWTSGAHYIPNAPRDNSTDDPCVNVGTELCVYPLMDFSFLYPTTLTATPSSGDSGTPLEINKNHVFSIAKAEHLSINPEWVQLTNLGWYLPVIADQVNKVVAPSHMEFTYQEGVSETKTVKVAFQNLTGLTETLNPYLLGDTSVFSVSGCNTALQPLESCEISLTIVGEANYAVVNMFLGDSNDTVVPVEYMAELTSDSDASTDDSSNAGGGGGGGTVGWMTLFAMFALIGARRK